MTHIDCLVYESNKMDFDIKEEVFHHYLCRAVCVFLVALILNNSLANACSVHQNLLMNKTKLNAQTHMKKSAADLTVHTVSMSHAKQTVAELTNSNFKLFFSHSFILYISAFCFLVLYIHLVMSYVPHVLNKNIPIVCKKIRAYFHSIERGKISTSPKL